MNPILVFIVRLLLILLAYTFVGWIVYSIFKDLRHGSVKPLPESLSPITLTSEINDEVQSKQFSISPITIGRDPANDVYIDQPTISLRHCRISFSHKQWWAEDLDSTNGSHLNNSQINTPVVLTDGDELRLGEVTLKISIN